MEDTKEESIKKTQEKLDKILRNCDTCKAKMCGICSNSKMKKSLKSKLKELGFCSNSNENIVDSIKILLKKLLKI